MKSNLVTVQLSIESEFLLMEKYGRRCSRESLVARVLADAIKKLSPASAVKKTRKKKEAAANGLDDSKQPEQLL